MNDELRKTLDVLDGVREMSSGGWEACCPAHNDTNASLTVDAGDRAPVVVKCHKGCGQRAVLEALRDRVNGHAPASLTEDGDAASDDAATEKEIPDWDLWDDGEEVASYSYTDASGDELFQVVRFEPKPSHPARGLDKEFLQRTADGWGRDGIEPPLYHLPEVRRPPPRASRCSSPKAKKTSRRCAGPG
jgi:hypothetical protein